MSDQIQLQFGAMADPIRTQLKSQGIKADAKSFARWQKLHDALCILKVHGILGGAGLAKAAEKLFKRIVTECKATASKLPAAKGRKGA